MSAPEHGSFRSVNVDDLPWRPSAMASGVFVKDIVVTDGWEMQLVQFEPGARFPVHTHESPEFLFILEGELVQAGRRMGHAVGIVAKPPNSALQAAGASPHSTNNGLGPGRRACST